MLSLLDMVLENTTYTRGGASVVSENHDVSTIRVESNAIDAAIGRLSGGRTWDAAEYGMTLAQAQAAFENANTPEARARVEADLRQRAIRRANLDVTNGRVSLMVAGKPAWHGLGVLIREACDSAQAIALAGLGWEADKLPLMFRNPRTGELEASKSAWSIVRRDTGIELGSVGSRYQPLQNAEGFQFLDKVLAEFGAKYEAAGALYGGKSVFMLVHLPAQQFRVSGTDVIEPYALFQNSHDGTGSAKCFPTSVRVECANTLRQACRAGDGRGLNIRHTGDLRTKVKDGQRALGVAVKEFETFKESAEVMVRSKIDEKTYFADLLDVACDVTAAEQRMGADALARRDLVEAAVAITEAELKHKRKEYERKIDNRVATLEDILERYDSERCGTGGMRGTAWAAFNAVTESADHGTLGGKVQGKDADTKLSRRFESVVSGRADEVKQTAYEMVMSRVNRA